MLMIVDAGMPIAEVAKKSGIHLRTLYRYRDKFIKDKKSPKQVKTKEIDVVVHKEITVPNEYLQKKGEAALTERAQFLDALQKTLKTLTDFEGVGMEKDKEPGKFANTVSMFNFFNQQLINEGYEGSKLTNTDIVGGIDSRPNYVLLDSSLILTIKSQAFMILKKETFP